METYKDSMELEREGVFAIIGKTNGYIASKDKLFNGKTEIILANNLTLDAAENILIDMYNDYYADELGYFHTLLDAYMENGNNSYIDSNLIAFEYDSRKFYIEPVEE